MVQRVSVFDPQTFPFFGVVPAILNESGEELEGPCEGYLVSIRDHHDDDRKLVYVILLLPSHRLSVRCSNSRGRV